MEQGNWVPLDKALIAALPRKRPYTLLEAVFSYQVDLDNGTVRGFREYARIWQWSLKKTVGFIRNKQGTKTEQARNTQETVKFRFVNPLQESKKQAGDKQDTKTEHAGDTTNNPNPILDPKSSKELGNKGMHPDGVHSIPLSFNEYKKKSPVDDGIRVGIEYFLTKYKKHKRTEHPNLKPKQWGSVCNTLFLCWDDNRNTTFDVDLDALKIMINKYFRTEFKADCNYSILHFNSNGVKVRRMYEVAY